MKVFVIYVLDYEDSFIYGVVSDEDVAKNIVKRLGVPAEYYEFLLDDLSVDSKLNFYIGIRKNGRCYMSEPTYEKFTISSLSKKWDEGDMVFDIVADNLDQAKVIAYEMRKKELEG